MRVCLLISTYNRTPQLRKSLQRLSELTLPDEILLIDDGGSDGCDQIPEEFPNLPIQYHGLDNPGLNLSSYPRNYGIKQTAAQLVITSEPEMWFITDVVKQMKDRWIELAGTKVISAGTVYHAQDQWMTMPEQCNRLEGWVATYVACYGRDWLMRVGGWAEGVPGDPSTPQGPWGHDDTELLTRLRIHGWGQDIDRSIEAMHQWHDNPGRDKFGALVNDGWVKSLDYEDNPERAIANQGREWGTGYVPRELLYQ